MTTTTAICPEHGAKSTDRVGENTKGEPVWCCYAGGAVGQRHYFTVRPEAQAGPVSSRKKAGKR